MSVRHPACNVSRPSSSKSTGMAARSAVYDKVYSTTKNHKAAVEASTNGNKWATENAKATGNI